MLGQGVPNAGRGVGGCDGRGCRAQAGSDGGCVPGPGVLCPFRHVGREKMVVCKHWLRGLCKKGDGCDFLHEYDATKMPECYFYSKFGRCGTGPGTSASLSHPSTHVPRV